MIDTKNRQRATAATYGRFTVEERLDKIEIALNQLLTAFDASQGTHNPAPSGSIEGEVPEKSHSKESAMMPTAHSPEVASAISEETPVSMADGSSRSATAQVSDPEHPMEKSFWEAMRDFCRRETQWEMRFLVGEALEAIRKRSNEAMQK